MVKQATVKPGSRIESFQSELEEIFRDLIRAKHSGSISICLEEPYGKMPGHYEDESRRLMNRFIKLAVETMMEARDKTEAMNVINDMLRSKLGQHERGLRWPEIQLILSKIALKIATKSAHQLRSKPQLAGDTRAQVAQVVH